MVSFLGSGDWAGATAIGMLQFKMFFAKWYKTEKSNI